MKEISNLSNKEFKVTVTKMLLTSLREAYELNENFNKKKNKKESELKNNRNERKKNQRESTEEWNSDLED